MRFSHAERGKMADIDNIFKRATMKGITSYLLYGQVEEPDTRDYETRLNEAFAEFDEEALKLDKRQPPKLLDKVNALVSEAEDIYTEIGLKTGILLMNDLMEDTNIYAKEKIAMYKKMYCALFNSVTNALEILKSKETNDIDTVIAMLEKAQRKTEKIFIKTESVK